jgi:hypothetical protein
VRREDVDSATVETLQSRPLRHHMFNRPANLAQFPAKSLAIKSIDFVHRKYLVTTFSPH